MSAEQMGPQHLPPARERANLGILDASVRGVRLRYRNLFRLVPVRVHFPVDVILILLSIEPLLPDVDALISEQADPLGSETIR
jgi:hypothetical protein